jgi:hypothetical protein
MTHIKQFPPASFYFPLPPLGPNIFLGTLVSHTSPICIIFCLIGVPNIKYLASVLRICKAQEAVTFNEVWWICDSSESVQNFKESPLIYNYRTVKNSFQLKGIHHLEHWDGLWTVNSKTERSGCDLLQCTVPVFVKRDRKIPWKVLIGMFDSCLKFKTSTLFHVHGSVHHQW